MQTERDAISSTNTFGRPSPPMPEPAERRRRLPMMTDVPEHWVPFIPVHIPGRSRQVGLIEAVLPRPDSLGDLVTRRLARACCRSCAGGAARRGVPTAGIVVRRRWFLARSADGGRHAWAARSVTTGRGEGASGLRFDVAEPVAR